MTEHSPTYEVQTGMFSPLATPPGLTAQQDAVYRVVSQDEESKYNAARLTFLCWWQAGLRYTLPQEVCDKVLKFLDLNPGGRNPEGYSRRLRELVEMKLVDLPKPEAERRQRMAHAGPPGRNRRR